MGLKERLIENKKQNLEIQYEVSELQSKLSYELGYETYKTPPINYEALYDPFIKIYADIQLQLGNGTAENPVEARKYADSIMKSIGTVKEAMENIGSNTELWQDAIILSGLMGGVDLMGTPLSRYRAMHILDDNLEGVVEIMAEDMDISRLAWVIYDKKGNFVEKIFLNKLNILSETQNMFVDIPNTSEQNQKFKKANPEIFDVKQMGTDAKETALTGGINKNYRKNKADGSPDLYQKPIGDGMVQDFQKIDKQAIRSSLPFQLGMDKITAELLGMYESDDQVVAFNNNILSQVTDYYLQPGKALREKAKTKFTEDYKDWFLEKEISEEMPIGSPKPKAEEKVEVEEEVVAEQKPDGQEEVKVEEQVQVS